jgi:hypothetical protein
MFNGRGGQHDILNNVKPLCLSSELCTDLLLY